MNQNKSPATLAGGNPSAVAGAVKAPPDNSSSLSTGQATAAGPKLSLDAAWATDTGRSRDHNEDAIGGTPADYPLAASRGYLFIVADGMGGHNAGEVASNEAAKRVYQRYYASSEPNVFRSLELIMRGVNNELFQQAEANPAQRGMGTTMTAFVIKDNHLTAAHVGDSRLYLIRGGKIEQVTHDHSWVEEQVRAGVLTRLQAESHPQRNVITRALATAPDVRVDPFELDLQIGDILVFCSDGLNTEVGDPQIAAVATKAASTEEAVRQLIRLANENGGEDNISVGVIRVRQATGTPAPTTTADAPTAVGGATGANARRKSFIVPIIVGVAVVVVAAGGYAAFGASLLNRPASPPVITLTTAPVSGTPIVTPLMTATNQAEAPGRSAAAEPTTQPAAAAAPAVSATSTLAPTAAPIPSATARPARPQPGGTQPPPTPPGETPPGRPNVAAPVLLEPPPGETVSSRTTFKWQAVELPPGAAYQVVWWREDANPDTAKGFAESTLETTQEVDIAGYASQSDLPANQAIRWTVIVVNKAPYRRLIPPSADNYRKLTYVPSSDKNGCVGACGK